jgi:hypothetical protein
MELLAYVIGAVLLGLVGVRVGMLLAPRVGRWAERGAPPEDEPGDGDA